MSAIPVAAAAENVTLIDPRDRSPRSAARARGK
jgi:hypothetical protein